MADGVSDTVGLFDIEVAYAKTEEQVIIMLKVQQGATVEDVVKLSGLLERFPEINHSALKVGVFGTACKPEQAVKEGDRVEIYRPLIHDPKDARRHRARKK